MSANGTAIVLPDRAQAIANYPHCRRANGLIYVSGISSRRLDNTYEGVEERADGTLALDIRAQTRAVLNNIRVILQAAGADLSHAVDLQVFLVDMGDYKGMNEVYNEFFTAANGPSRTTVAVKQLPSPKLLVEIKLIAVDPAASAAATSRAGGAWVHAVVWPALVGLLAGVAGGLAAVALAARRGRAL